MALRFSSKRAAASLKACSQPSVLRSSLLSRAASTATATAEKTGAKTLTNPDPAPGSDSAVLVAEHSKYMVKTYARPPPVFVRGRGSFLYDAEERPYLDFTSGIAVNALGHCDPELSEIIADQAATLMHASNLYYNPWTGALSQLLVEKTRSSGGMHDASAVFVCNSGSEANEAALKFARKAGKVVDPTGNKIEVVSFHNSFHGRTMGSLSATPNPKYQQPFAPMLPGFRYGTYNDIDAIPHLVTETTCGVIVEPIQGEGGVQVATTEFLTALAKRCREVGAVLIYDEIQCGLARTGTFWAHAGLPEVAHPDIITTAKALGNGFPIGATIVNDNVAEKIKVGDHGTTFGGNPLGSRVAHAIVTRLSSTSLQADVAAKSLFLTGQLKSLQEKYPQLISEVRGRGLILGLQLNQDPTPIVAAARERGLLIITAGTNTLRFVPALTITEEELAQGIAILDDAISSVVNIV